MGLRLLRLLHALLALATLAGALYAWRIRCEGFGCNGLGIVWMAWALALLSPSLLLGAWLVLGRRRPEDAWSLLSRLAWQSSLVLGAGLGLYALLRTLG